MALLRLTDHLRRTNPLVVDALVAIGFASMALGTIISTQAREARA